MTLNSITAHALKIWILEVQSHDFLWETLLQWWLAHEGDLAEICSREQLSRSSQNLSINKSTVSRISQLFDTSGSVCKKSYSVIGLIEWYARSTSNFSTSYGEGWEIQQELLKTRWVNVSESAIFRFEQEWLYISTQRDELTIQLFISDMSLYSADMLVFVYETGADSMASKAWL